MQQLLKLVHLEPANCNYWDHVLQELQNLSALEPVLYKRNHCNEKPGQLESSLCFPQLEKDWMQEEKKKHSTAKKQNIDR